MNIEAIIKAAREVVAAHEAHDKALAAMRTLGQVSDAWQACCDAKMALLNVEGVPMPSEEGGALALARLVIAAFDAGYDNGHGDGLDDGMTK